jgi:uncharacterized protein YdhG (YjbR/CyaY superfamily)
MTKPVSVDDYLAGLPAAARRVFRRLRRTIRQALPGADEVISYSIPAYRQHGRVVLYVAVWKAHYSIYPATRQLEQAFRTELAGYETSGRGTIQFPIDEPVPERLIARLAKFRAKEVADAAERRAVARRRGAAGTVTGQRASTTKAGTAAKIPSNAGRRTRAKSPSIRPAGRKTS